MREGADSRDWANSTDSTDSARLFGGQKEDAFLERIRARIRAQGGPRGGSADASPAYTPGRYWSAPEEELPFDERFRLFEESLERVGGMVRRVRTPVDAWDVVAAELEKEGARCVLAGGGDWTECARRLDTSGIRLERWDELTFALGTGERSLERVNQWDAGIDWVDYAVAELGSVVVVASARQSRSVSLIPPMHIALIAADRLLTRRKSVLTRIAQEAKASGRPPSFTFITGPSRSADIEMDLSIGVHGPGKTLAIVVEEVP